MTLEKSLVDQLKAVRTECPQYDPKLETPLLRLTNWYCLQKDFTQARPLLEELLTLREIIYGNDHPKVALTLSQLGSLAGQFGDFPKLEQHLLRAVEILKQSLETTCFPTLINTMNQLVEAYFQQERIEKALRLCKAVAKLLQTSPGELTKERLRTFNNLGSIHVARGEYVLAERLFQQNVRLCAQVYKSDDPILATNYNNLAEVNRLRGKLDVAESLLVHAIRIWRKAYGNQHPLFAQGLLNLAIVRQHSGNRRDTIELLLKKSLKIRRQSLSPNHPNVSALLRHLSDFLTEEGRADEIESLYQEMFQ